MRGEKPRGTIVKTSQKMSVLIREIRCIALFFDKNDLGQKNGTVPGDSAIVLPTMILPNLFFTPPPIPTDCGLCDSMDKMADSAS